MCRLVIPALVALMLAGPLTTAANQDQHAQPRSCPRPRAAEAATPFPATPQVEEPRIVLCAETTQLQPAEVVWVIGETTNLGLPIFQIDLRDAGMAEFSTVAEVDYRNEVRRWEPRGDVLEPVAACGGMAGMAVAFRALAPGETEVRVTGLGEVHERSEGRDIYSWGSARSEPLRIVVSAGRATPPPPVASPVIGDPVGTCPMTSN